MTREERLTRTDRMRYTKDTLASSLVLVAIALDALYFVSIYNSDVGSYYYTLQIGASIIYNLVFMLVAFLCSEGVKNRLKGYWAALIGIGVMQFVRVFYLPALAHEAFVTIKGEQIQVMTDGQYAYVVVCLVISGLCCLAAAAISYVNNRTLSRYLRELETQTH